MRLEEWMKRKRVLLSSVPPWALVVAAFFVCSVVLRQSYPVSPGGIVAVGGGTNRGDAVSATEATEGRTRRKWVSLSVCFGDTEKEYNKRNFPYLLATELSVALWKNKTDADVVVQVVHNGSSSSSSSVGDVFLFDFLHRLRSLGAEAVAVEADQGLGSCVLQSQLQRAFAFRLPFVSDSDLVVTSDVDIFVMDPRLLEDLGRTDHYDTWVYQYQTTARTGGTFGMSFLAMSARDWRSLLSDAPGPFALVDSMRDYLTSHFEVWTYDQVLLTRLILESGRCALDRHNPLWISLDLEPVEKEEGKDRCFHGEGFQDCNRDRKSESVVERCRVWHFHPYEREEELREKYEEILGVRKPKTGLARTAADVKLELAKILGFRNRRRR